MTIERLDKYVEALWDWGFLDQCFGQTRIRVSDVDGIVERNGHFLLIEAKGPGVAVKRGQLLCFRRLAKDKGFTILFIWGERNKPEKISLWRPGQNDPDPSVSADEKYVQSFVSWWFETVTPTPSMPAPEAKPEPSNLCIQCGQKVNSCFDGLTLAIGALHWGACVYSEQAVSRVKQEAA